MSLSPDDFERLLAEARRLRQSEDEEDQRQADRMTRFVIDPNLTDEQARKLSDVLHDF